MIPIFATCAVIGFALLLVSSIAGAFGHGLDHSLEHDLSGGDVVGHDVSDSHIGSHFDHSAIPFINIRFWTYALAAFGLSGLGLVFLAKLSQGSAFAIALLFGITVGYLFFLFFRFVKKAQSGEVTSLENLVGAHGKLLVGASALQPGKVRITVNGETIDCIAHTEETAIPAGHEVAVLRTRGDDVVVQSVQELFEEQTEHVTS